MIRIIILCLNRGYIAPNYPLNKITLFTAPECPKTLPGQNSIFANSIIRLKLPLQVKIKIIHFIIPEAA